jgi:hypothetical protein
MSKRKTHFHRHPLHLGTSAQSPSPSSWWIGVPQGEAWAKIVRDKQETLQGSTFGKANYLSLHNSPTDPSVEARWRKSRKRALDEAKERRQR